MTSTKACKICKKSVGKRLKLQCGSCKGYVHLECGKITEVEARLMQANKTPWTCTGCSVENTNSTRQSTLFSQAANVDREPTRRRSDLFARSVEVNNGGYDTELKLMIRELQEEIREMRRAMEFFNERYEEEARRNQVLSDMVTEVSRDNQELKKEVQKLKVVLNTQEHIKLKNNICVTGLLEESDDSPASKIKLRKLFENLEVRVTEDDLYSVKNIRTGNGAKAIITFRSIELKQQILKARAKKGRLTKRNMGMGDLTTAIFIEEELTKDAYALFKKAKQQLKDKFKYVWHRNGRVLARKQDGERYVVIGTEADLEELV